MSKLLNFSPSFTGPHGYFNGLLLDTLISLLIPIHQFIWFVDFDFSLAFTVFLGFLVQIRPDLLTGKNDLRRVRRTVTWQHVGKGDMDKFVIGENAQRVDINQCPVLYLSVCQSSNLI